MSNPSGARAALGGSSPRDGGGPQVASLLLVLVAWSLVLGGTPRGALAAFSLEDATEVWRTRGAYAPGDPDTLRWVDLPSGGVWLFVSAGVLHAVRPDGTLVWQLGGRFVDRIVAVEDFRGGGRLEALVTAAREGYRIALVDVSSGELRWEEDDFAPETVRLTTESILWVDAPRGPGKWLVYAAGNEARVRAVALASGEEVWRFVTTRYHRVLPLLAGRFLAETPAQVLVPGSGGFWLLDLETGDLLEDIRPRHHDGQLLSDLRALRVAGDTLDSLVVINAGAADTFQWGRYLPAERRWAWRRHLPNEERPLELHIPPVPLGGWSAEGHDRARPALWFSLRGALSWGEGRLPDRHPGWTTLVVDLRDGELLELIDGVRLEALWEQDDAVRGFVASEDMGTGTLLGQSVVHYTLWGRGGGSWRVERQERQREPLRHTQQRTPGVARYAQPLPLVVDIAAGLWFAPSPGASSAQPVPWQRWRHDGARWRMVEELRFEGAWLPVRALEDGGWVAFNTERGLRVGWPNRPEQLETETGPAASPLLVQMPVSAGRSGEGTRFVLALGVRWTQAWRWPAGDAAPELLWVTREELVGNSLVAVPGTEASPAGRWLWWERGGEGWRWRATAEDGQTLWSRPSVTGAAGWGRWAYRSALGDVLLAAQETIAGGAGTDRRMVLVTIDPASGQAQVEGVVAHSLGGLVGLVVDGPSPHWALLLRQGYLWAADSTTPVDVDGRFEAILPLRGVASDVPTYVFVGRWSGASQEAAACSWSLGARTPRWCTPAAYPGEAAGAVAGVVDTPAVSKLVLGGARGQVRMVDGVAGTLVWEACLEAGNVRRLEAPDGRPLGGTCLGAPLRGLHVVAAGAEASRFLLGGADGWIYALDMLGRVRGTRRVASALTGLHWLQRSLDEGYLGVHLSTGDLVFLGAASEVGEPVADEDVPDWRPDSDATSEGDAVILPEPDVMDPDAAGGVGQRPHLPGLPDVGAAESAAPPSRSSAGGCGGCAATRQGRAPAAPPLFALWLLWVRRVRGPRAAIGSRCDARR